VGGGSGAQRFSLQPTDLCHPSAAEGSAVSAFRGTKVQVYNRPDLCHPERSRGICSPPSGAQRFRSTTDLTFVIPPVRRAVEPNPGVPTARHHRWPRVRLSLKEADEPSQRHRALQEIRGKRRDLQFTFSKQSPDQVARMPEYTAIPATASTPISSRASISDCSRMPQPQSAAAWSLLETVRHLDRKACMVLPDRYVCRETCHNTARAGEWLLPA